MADNAPRNAFIFELDSSPSVFRSNVETPPFSVLYRWWEDEANSVLWGFDCLEISRTIRFGLFHDENHPRNSLLIRSPDMVNKLLAALSEQHEYWYLAELSVSQQVDEILIRSRTPRSQLIPWRWLPPVPACFSDAKAIALQIEAESHSHFRQIAFEEIVRSALGYEAPSVEWFLQQHMALRDFLVRHIRIYPEQFELYLAVEEHLRGLSPFAHQALAQCIVAVQLNKTYNIASHDTPGFSFIANPIQKLFKTQSCSLSQMLKTLSVLAVRFRREYKEVANMSWKLNFGTRHDFLEDCFTSSAADFAKNMIHTDKCSFARLSKGSLIEHDDVVSGIFAHWEALSNCVWECCSGLPDLVPYLQDCALRLYDARDYHSFMAILDGLRKYSISAFGSNEIRDHLAGGTILPVSSIPAEIMSLANPHLNFLSYREHYDRNPGIPYLHPHIRGYKQGGESMLQPLVDAKIIQS